MVKSSLTVYNWSALVVSENVQNTIVDWIRIVELN